MVELIKGIKLIIGALIVSIILIPIETLYSLGYSIWLLITFKDWTKFFIFWLKLIDGILSAIGNLMYHIAIVLDQVWNINGELLEDITTNKENTLFGTKNITVSASIGHLQKNHYLKKSGKILSKILNIVFGQKSHALDAYELHIKEQELKDKYFQ